mgnify:CR=1 FL=1
MANAKDEFLTFIGDIESNIKCAYVIHNHFDMFSDDQSRKQFLLPVNYTPEQCDEFINALDFNYDAGYGLQELYGNVWFTDGTWADRGEYDGSEWWQHHSCPQIPEALQPNVQ